MKDVLVSCVKAFNGEYSLSGIVKILTGYYGFKFIPKMKNSSFYGYFDSSKSDDILRELEELKEQGILIVKDNHKVYTSEIISSLSEDKVEYERPVYKRNEDKPTFLPTEDLLKVVYNEELNNVDDFTKKIIKLIDKKENLFITGGAGTGKSYLLNQLKQHYRNSLQITSTTGISALNVSGQTIHSWAGIGIADRPIEDVVKSIKKKPTLLKQILLTEILAIDEISMLDNDTMDYLNDTLKAVRKNNKPFGGIQVLLFGDFFQLPPVGLEQDSDIDFCFNSRTWKELNLKNILLTEVKRQSDVEFINALNNVREDKVDIEDMKVFFKCDYPAEYEPSKDILQIFSTNNKADAYNAQCFEELETPPFTYESKDELYVYDKYNEGTVIDINNTNEKISEYDDKCIKRFNEDCKAPHLLNLKVGCRVMLVKNQNVKGGLVNGSCGTVVFLSENAIIVKFDNGVETSVNKEVFEYTKENKPKIRRQQYPLRLAYGITIHKSQGMTFDKLVVNFNRIFDYGQAYVALSRTRGLSGLIIKGFDPNKIKANPRVVEFYKNLKCEVV